MDNLNQKIKHLVQKGKEKGYLTYEELNDMLPDDADISPEKIDDILMMLDELGIDLIDETEIESRDVADAEEAPVFQEVDLEFGEVPTITEKIDDPVRMYLTQMGEIPCLHEMKKSCLQKDRNYEKAIFKEGPAFRPLTGNLFKDIGGCE